MKEAGCLPGFAQASPKLCLNQIACRSEPLFCTGAGSLRGLVRQLSIDQFENEGRRVAMHSDAMGKTPVRSPLFERQTSGPGLHKV